MKNTTTKKLLPSFTLAFLILFSFSIVSASEVIGVLSSDIQNNSGTIGGNVSSGSEVLGTLGGNSSNNTNSGTIGGNVSSGSEVLGTLGGNSSNNTNSGTIGGNVSSGSEVGGTLGGNSSNNGTITGNVSGGTTGGSGGGGSFTPLPQVLGVSTTSVNNSIPTPQVLGESYVGFPDTGFGPKNNNLVNILVSLAVLLIIISSIILFPQKRKI